MMAVARSSLIFLGRHTGDERRRWVPPLHTADVLPSNAALCASTACPFVRWQTDLNQHYTVQHGSVCASGLPLQSHDVLYAGRMLRSAPIIWADIA